MKSVRCCDSWSQPALTPRPAWISQLLRPHSIRHILHQIMQSSVELILLVLSSLVSCQCQCESPSLSICVPILFPVMHAILSLYSSAHFWHNFRPHFPNRKRKAILQSLTPVTASYDPCPSSFLSSYPWANPAAYLPASPPLFPA